MGRNLDGLDRRVIIENLRLVAYYIARNDLPKAKEILQGEIDKLVDWNK